jgi:ABC-2 type transport system permease protein
MRRLRHIARLGAKELISVFRDPVLIFLIVYCFTFSVYAPAKSAVMEVKNASVAVVDEDDSAASRQIIDALLPPLFLRPARIPFSAINQVMEESQYTFVLDIPPRFQHDLKKGSPPTIEIVSDATAMSQAGRGPSYIENIVNKAVEPYRADKQTGQSREFARLVTRARFNPNMHQGWFDAINQIINNITVLAIFLTGAAVLRERERGTIEHLLVMPLHPYELMFAKIWANGLVVLVAAMGSLFLVVKGALGVPVAGSVWLFAGGLVAYLFSVTALGILLATVVRSMPQFGLLAFPVFIMMNLLSGGQTPLESMPVLLQRIMQFVPSTAFVSFSQAVLFRNASPSMVWRDLLKMFLIGSAYMAFSLSRFRRMLAAIQ